MLRGNNIEKWNNNKRCGKSIRSGKVATRGLHGLTWNKNLRKKLRKQHLQASWKALPCIGVNQGRQQKVLEIKGIRNKSRNV